MDETVLVNSSPPNGPVKQKKHKLILLAIAGIAVLVGLGAALVKLGMPQISRKLGIVQVDADGFFEAMEKQDLVYDFDGDGAVTNEDYTLLVEQKTGVKTETGDGETTTGEEKQDQVLGTMTSDPTSAGNIPLPSTKGFGGDGFNGAVTVSYPIDTPQGNAGIFPALSVSYSSTAVDDQYTGTLTSLRNDANHNYQQQAGNMGLGWSLNGFGQITRDMRGTLNDPADDTFMISFSGGSANLTLESGNPDVVSVWRTVPNLMVKVERYARCKTHVESGDKVCRYSWIVRTGDGTTYYFGSGSTLTAWQRDKDPDADETFTDPLGSGWYPLYDTVSDGSINGFRAYQYYGPISSLHAITYKWPLVRVTNIYNISMDFKTDFEINTDTGTSDTGYYVKASYPHKITYAKNEIEIQRENRLDYSVHLGTTKDIATGQQVMWAGQRLKKILVKRQNAAGAWKNIKTYVFDYNYGWDPGKHDDDGDGTAESGEVVSGQAIHSLLTKITVWSTLDTDSGAKKLPAYIFSYGDNCDTFRGGCPLYSMIRKNSPDQSRTANDFFLMSADNGLNGKTVFSYWSDDGSNGKALNVKYCSPTRLTTDYFPDGGGKDCLTDNEYNTQRHRVAGTTTYDGMGNYVKTDYLYTGTNSNPPLAYVKDYGRTVKDCECSCNCSLNCSWNNLPAPFGKCGPITNSCCNSCSPSRCDISSFSGYEFLGYPEVTTKVYQKNSTTAPAAQTKTNFHQKMETATCLKPSPLKGMAINTLTYDVTNLTRYSEQVTDYRVRFGDMFTSYVSKTPAEMNDYCSTYNPETTVSLTMPVTNISKEVINSTPVLCTKSTTDYTNLDGSVDHYAMPHTVTDYGKVNCSTYADDASDTFITSYSTHTNANTARWILPQTKESWSGNTTTKYGHTRTYYDNLGLGSVGAYLNTSKTEIMKDGAIYATTLYGYNATYPWQQTTITDPEGKRTTTVYDTNFRIYPVRVTNAAGHITNIEYDFNTADTSLPNRGGALGLAVKSTDPNGAITYNVYDVFGRLTSTYLPGKSPAAGSLPSRIFSYHYFNESDGISPCDSNTHCLVGLGKNNSPKLLVGEGGRYSDAGGVGQLSSKHQMYNGLGQLVQTRSGWLNNNWTADLGIPVADEGLKDIITSTRYNSLGQTEWQSLPYTTATFVYPNTSYDARDFVADTNIKKTGYTFDGLARSKTTTYPDSTKDTVVYDLDGNPLKVKMLDKNCNDTDSTSLCTEKISLSDAFGRTYQTQEIEQGGITYTTNYLFHPVLGSPTEVRDTKGNLVNKTEYDTLGRKVKMWEIDMSPKMTEDINSWRYEFNKLGNISKQTNPKGVISEIQYVDSLNRPTKKIVDGKTVSESFYDTCVNGKGKLCTAKSYNPAGILIENLSFEYNNRGLVTKDSKTLSNMPDAAINNKTFSTSYTYDEGGRVLTTTLPTDSTFNIGAETLTYSYNRPFLSYILSSIGSLKYVQNTAYNKNGQLVSDQSGNGITGTYGYNANNLRMTQLRISGASLPVLDGINNSYFYDSSGNIKQIQDASGRPSTDPFSFAQTFAYDYLNRLKTVSGAYAADFAYDTIGNITSKNEGSNRVDLAYGNYSATGPSNYHRPRSVTIDGITANMQYDQIGNLMQDYRNSYEYDADNRLIATSPLTSTASADANGDGVVNNLDYNIWLANYGTNVAGGPAAGDFNHSGYVDGVDYNIWRANYTGTATPVPTNVPTSTPTRTPTPSPTGISIPTPTRTPTPRPTLIPSPYLTPPVGASCLSFQDAAVITRSTYSCTGASNYATASLSWNCHTGADSYQLTWRVTENSGTITSSSYITTTTSITWPDNLVFDGNKTHSFRVRPKSGNIYGTYSAWVSIPTARCP